MIESWGYFYGWTLMDRYFGEYNAEYDYLSRLEKGNVLPYFYYSSYHDLHDTSFYDKETDLYDALPLSKIFEPYKYSSTKSVKDWYKKLLEVNEWSDEDKSIYNTLVNNEVDL